LDNAAKHPRTEFIPYGRQYIDDDDIRAVTEVLRSPYITSGPRVRALEDRLCGITGAAYAVAVSSGTAALHAACAAAGISSGDEVIVPPITFAASANCVLYCGGTPVFSDIDPDTWNIDPAGIEKHITGKTKAVIAVDYTGQAADLDPIKALCRKHRLLLIEDAAHALGTRYKNQPVGSIADMTAFSFHPVKTVTAGEGGAVLTNNEAFYKKLLRFRTHGIEYEPSLLSQNPYKGFAEQVALGYNYRLTDFQAALCVSQLEKLELFIRRRSEIVRRYNEAFSGVPGLILQKEIPGSDTARHLYVLRLDTKTLRCDRGAFARRLHEKNVGYQVHYMPVYYHPYYRGLGYLKGLCPVAEALYEEILTIPLFFGMTDEDVESVIEAVLMTAAAFMETAP
jgi:UDP-4-amino-4,6-dideoxy-N-acetyl-beta-L-altrosamine transaminase